MLSNDLLVSKTRQHSLEIKAQRARFCRAGQEYLMPRMMISRGFAVIISCHPFQFSLGLAKLRERKAIPLKGIILLCVCVCVATFFFYK